MGLGGMIGKGKRSKEVVDAIVRNGSVYFAAVGGAGALLSKRILSSEVIAYDDLGTEAIRRLDGSLRLQEADVRLYSRFYSYGMCGIIHDWVRGGMKESPESLSLRIRKLANDSEKMASLRLQGQF